MSQFRKGHDARRKDPREAGKLGGRPPTAFLERCREYVDKKGFANVVQLAERARQERTKLEANKFLTEYGYGKPPQPVTGEAGGPLEVIIKYADR